MPHKLFLALIILGGVLATCTLLFVVVWAWGVWPPADLPKVIDAFWQNHAWPDAIYEQAGVLAWLALALLWDVWPLLFVVGFGVLGTYTVLRRYMDEEAGAYLERIHRLDLRVEGLTETNQNLEQRWERLERALDAVFDGGGELWLVMGRDGRIRRWNLVAINFARRFHPNLESMEGRSVAELWRGFGGSELAKLMSNPDMKPWHGEMPLADDGIVLMCWIWPMGDDVAVLARDVTGQHIGVDQLANAEAMLRYFVEESVRPLAVVDSAWRYIYVAQSWVQFFHLDGQVSWRGRAHFQAVPNFPMPQVDLERRLASGQRVGDEDLTLNIAGREEVVKWAIRPWRDNENRVGGYIITLTPITELARLRAQVKQGLERENMLAYSDSLTGLPNRQLFNDRLNMALATAYRQLSKVALIFIDLDGFKAVNDTLGHDYGDLLLKQVAMRLKGALRESDTVARLGGDEFVVILSVRDRADAEIVASKVLKLLHTPFDLNGKPANIGGSLGVAMYPLNGNTADDLIKAADAAMYEAKHGGKNAYKFAGDKKLVG